MKAREWKKLVQPILPDDWVVRGSLCYLKPTGRVLYGVLAENSSYGTGAYVWHVVVPLFEPSDGELSLSHSERVGFWEQSEHEPLTEAIERGFTDLPSEEALLRRWAGWGFDVNTQRQEVAASALVLLGDVDEALRVVKAVAGTGGADNRDWVLEAEERVARLGEILTSEGRDAAITHLDAIVRETCTALKIETG